MKKILVILGPTSTGKTDLALNLAGKFNGEIIACDSRQVYTGLDIGTGKMPTLESKVKKGKGYWEINGVAIWMYDVVDPKKQYSVADYVKDANRVLREIEDKGKLPIVVGGSGLYLKALLEGLSNLAIPIDKTLRKKLQKLSKEKLQEKLKRVSAGKWDNLNQSDRENPRRLVRAIELAIVPAQKRFKIYDLGFKKFDILKIGLTAPRAILYERVDERVIERIDQGMIEEAKRLHKNGLSSKRMRQLGLEYGVLADFLEGNMKDKSGLINILQGKIHGYVRRQLTWFKKPFDFAQGKEKSIHWFDITTSNYQDKIEKLTSDWYNETNDTKN